MTSEDIRTTTEAATTTAEKSPLDYARNFAESLVYASDEQLDALVLTCAVSHAVHSFTTVPRFLAAGERNSGKTVAAIHVPSMLAWKFFNATHATEPAIRSNFNTGEATIAVDEISKIFGEGGTNGRQNPLYKILLSGYESIATASQSVNRVAEEYSIYGVAFMSGIKKAVPDDLRSRCIVLQSKQAPDSVAKSLDDALDPDVRVIGFQLGKSLHSYIRKFTDVNGKDVLKEIFKNQLRNIHPKLSGRRKQVWGPLFAVAIAAGGDWPDRCLRAFLDLALDTGERVELVPEQQMLLDAADLAKERMTDEGVIYSRDLLTYIKSKDREIYEPMSDRALAKLMSRTLGDSQAIWGTYSYPLDNGEIEETPTAHKGWYMQEHILAASDLRHRMDLSVRREMTPDKFDDFFD